jgi:hypothetical protein
MLGQDGAILSIMELLGTGNDPPYYVEFGFHSTVRTKGSNTANLALNHGWQGLLMDCDNQDFAINLQREFVTSQNVLQLFEKYGVPDEPDYVSIDIDSCDLWVMSEIMPTYQPRLISVEYNSHFTADQAITFPNAEWEHWERDRVYGASLKALVLAAARFGYVLVHVCPPGDAFFVPEDILCGGLKEITNFAPYCDVVCQPPCTSGREQLMLDYEVYMRDGDMEAARKAAHVAHPQLTSE